MGKPRANEDVSAVSSRNRWSKAAPLLCVATTVLLTVGSAMAQEALRNSMAGQAAAEARRLRPESLPFTFKTGELRVLVAPSLGVDWNDNINTSKSNPQQDFILRPQVQLDLSYPVTHYNLLSLNVGFGYNKYLNHEELSTWSVQSGSELSFDIFVKDFWINLHDRFSYVQDSAREAAIAGSGEFGNINNTAGLSVTWDLADLTLTLGYDHSITISPATQFQSQDRSAELFVARAGLRLHPRVSAGVEATASFTAYEEMVLNDNSGYSAGVYADWRPGSYFRVQPRVGYSINQFKQTSISNQTSDVGSWYADVAITHDATKAVSYSINVGHEVRLGIESDAIEDSYVRLNVAWKIVRELSLNTSLSYEHGEQGQGNVVGNLTETYDWFGGGIGLSYPLIKRLSASLNYRLTVRSSDAANRGYSQNLVGLQLTYLLQ